MPWILIFRNKDGSDFAKTTSEKHDNMEVFRLTLLYECLKQLITNEFDGKKARISTKKAHSYGLFNDYMENEPALFKQVHSMGCATNKDARSHKDKH